MALRPLCTSATIWPPFRWPRSLSIVNALQGTGNGGETCTDEGDLLGGSEDRQGGRLLSMLAWRG